MCLMLWFCHAFQTFCSTLWSAEWPPDVGRSRVLYMSEKSTSEVWLLSFVLGREGHIGSSIRRNLEKTHGQDLGEDPLPYPFPLVYNILCASCYCHKMLRSCLHWQEKRLQLFFGGSKYRSHQCIVYFFWTVFPTTFIVFGSCCFSELFQNSIPLQNQYHQGKFPPVQENKHAHSDMGTVPSKCIFFLAFVLGDNI